MTRDSFVFYRSFFEAIQFLSDENQLIVYSAVCNFAINGIEPELQGMNLSVFILIKPQLSSFEIER